jgi:hypothetical protein
MSSILNQIGIFFTYRVLKLSILLFEKNLMPDFITRWVSRPDPWSLRECASCNIPTFVACRLASVTLSRGE